MDERDLEGTSSMLTTIDNPFNPHTNYEKWREWDKEQGYNTEEAIGRAVPLNRDSFENDIDYQNSIDNAYEIIMDADPFKTYVLVNHDGSIDTSNDEEDIGVI